MKGYGESVVAALDALLMDLPDEQPALLTRREASGQGWALRGLTLANELRRDPLRARGNGDDL